ncbi:MAG: hypothetical protein A2082_05730 [Chloroflexi bacterium GWC2_70_10]|nr:MAG: hypothetical protein A2082_05730 [Chloroflexi bacterium GWC2_70_10]
MDAEEVVRESVDRTEQRSGDRDQAADEQRRAPPAPPPPGGTGAAGAGEVEGRGGGEADPES